MTVLTPEHVRAALAGDKAAVKAVIDALTPVIQARVARALLRAGGRARGRDVRQEVADLTQEVFVALFRDGGRALRAWEPARGLSLVNFAGLVAEREVASLLRSGRRSPWSEDPTLAETVAERIDASAPPPSVEAVLASRELLGALLERLREQLSPLGMHLFTLIFVEECEVDDVCRRAAMKPDAVYAWRSRLGKLLARLGAELVAEGISETPGPRRKPGQHPALP